MTTQRASYCPVYVMQQRDKDRVFAQLGTLRDLVRGPAALRPPMDYIIKGLHDISASRRVTRDDMRHPQISIERLVECGDEASSEELICFDAECKTLRLNLSPGTPWRYDADTLWENLEALKLGRLIFLSW